MVTALAAEAAALSQSLGLAAQAEDHRKSAAELGGVVRALERFIESKPPDDASSRAELAKLDDELTALEKAAPAYPGWVFNRIYNRKRCSCAGVPRADTVG